MLQVCLVFRSACLGSDPAGENVHDGSELCGSVCSCFGVSARRTLKLCFRCPPSLVCIPSAEGLNPVNLSWIFELVLVGAWFSNGVAFRGDVWWASAGYGPWEVGGFRPPIPLLGLWRPSPALSFSVYPGIHLVSVFLVASSGWGNIKRLRPGGLRFKVRLSMLPLRMLLHPGFICWVHGSGLVVFIVNRWFRWVLCSSWRSHPRCLLSCVVRCKNPG